jgi:hypothetical protein
VSQEQRERKPAYPQKNPVKFKCPEGRHRVKGWCYIEVIPEEDGTVTEKNVHVTVEIPCTDVAPKGIDRRHLYNGKSGGSFTIDLSKE